MANISLVIKIDEELYKQQLGSDWSGNIWIHDAIVNGIQLPKGHGRLFDERDIVNGNYEIIGNRIYELEPILEAEKEAEKETERE